MKPTKQHLTTYRELLAGKITLDLAVRSFQLKGRSSLYARLWTITKYLNRKR